MLDPDLQKRGGRGVRSPRPCNNTNKQQCYHIYKEPQSEFSQFNIGGEPGEWDRRGLQTPTLFKTKIVHFVACVAGDGLEVVGERDNGCARETRVSRSRGPFFSATQATHFATLFKTGDTTF